MLAGGQNRTIRRTVTLFELILGAAMSLPGIWKNAISSEQGQLLPSILFLSAECLVICPDERTWFVVLS